MCRLFLLSCCALIVGTGIAAAQDAGKEFFEKKIRPVLVEHCYKCHSHEAKKPRGELYLDSRDGIRKGGARAPAIVPGKPAESLLLKAIRQTGELKMPLAPADRLPDAVVADFEQWIAMGAPDPRDTANASLPRKRGEEYDFVEAGKHWAYQPLRKPELPAVKNSAGTVSPIDCFIAAKLEASGLSPSPPADKRTLLRRAYYDLTGLPPTAGEVEAFEQDRAPDAFAKVVDRLLALPQYGERWARHWLDVARYADTKDGVLMYGDDRVRPYAYTYRDYVIKALNADTPVDRFIAEQLAADKLASLPRERGEEFEPWRLGAMGFLTLGRQFDNNFHDVIDDRIDVVTRGFLGLTVACARCHDHKYDAIPTADYYSLYGVFANSESPLEPPLADRPENCASLGDYEKQAGPHREKMQKMVDSQYALLIETARERVGDYLLRVATTEPDHAETAIYFLSLAPTDLRPPMVNKWRRYLARSERAEDPVFGPWYELMRLPEEGFSKAADLTLKTWQKTPRGTAAGGLNPLVAAALSAEKPDSKAAVARTYGALLAATYKEAKGKKATPEQQQLLDVLTSKQSPAYFPKSQTWHNMSRGEKDAYGGMKTQFDKIAVKMPAAPPRAMVLFDTTDMIEPKILKRGNPSSPGAIVPRQFLRILSPEKRQPFGPGSGRLDLARAIADTPLTWRVLANRIWMHHFGEPLVSTPSDFGTRSTPPSHPELLDYLAATLKAEGGSLKKLHRDIMLSSTYQQASFDRPNCREIDPDNKLLWRAHRRRLDFEAMRDTLLAVSGQLDRAMYGRPVDVANDPNNRRRTVYGLVDRQSLPGVYRAFDFASPDQSAERRPMTTVPQQALFGLNSPFMIEQAKALAARPEVTGSPSERIAALYRLAIARSPSAAEVQAGLRFVGNGAESSQLNAWQQYAQVLLLTNEVMFVD